MQDMWPGLFDPVKWSQVWRNLDTNITWEGLGKDHGLGLK